MKPKLSLAGLNTFRSVIALFAVAIAVGISALGQPLDGGQALADRTLLAALWIYVGATAVPWANLRGLAGSGAAPALVMAAWGVFLTAATAFAGWSAATDPAWRNDRPRAGEVRCVEAVTPPPASPPSGSVAPRVVLRVVPRAAPPPPTVVIPPAAAVVRAAGSTGVAAAPEAVAEDVEARPRSHHRRRRSEREGNGRAPAVWLERDPVPPAAPAP